MRVRALRTSFIGGFNNGGYRDYISRKIPLAPLGVPYGRTPYGGWPSSFFIAYFTGTTVLLEKTRVWT